MVGKIQHIYVTWFVLILWPHLNIILTYLVPWARYCSQRKIYLVALKTYVLWKNFRTVVANMTIACYGLKMHLYLASTMILTAFPLCMSTYQLINRTSLSIWEKCKLIDIVKHGRNQRSYVVLVSLFLKCHDNAFAPDIKRASLPYTIRE